MKRLCFFIIVFFASSCSPQFAVHPPATQTKEIQKTILAKCEALSERTYDKGGIGYKGFLNYCLQVHGWEGKYDLVLDEGIIIDIIIISTIAGTFAGIAGPSPTIVGCAIPGGPCFVK